MGRDSRRTRAIKRAKRNGNGTFGTAAADSDDDMDIVLEFVDDIVVSEQDIQDYYPQVQRMKRCPYRGDAPRTKRRNVAQLKHCLSVCIFKQSLLTSAPKIPSTNDCH